ncbi:MAG: hypothetical protein JWQ69_4792 [Pseudomonas sp.]|nr:hypothetical protein [Pseudomonas sp.]
MRYLQRASILGRSLAPDGLSKSLHATLLDRG